MDIQAVDNNRFKIYNDKIIPILNGLKKDSIIDDYRIIKDGGSEHVSIIQILEKKLIRKRPIEEGKRISEIYELGYALGISDEEMSYSTSGEFGLATVTLEQWEAS